MFHPITLFYFNIGKSNRTERKIKNTSPDVISAVNNNKEVKMEAWVSNDIRSDFFSTCRRQGYNAIISIFTNNSKSVFCLYTVDVDYTYASCQANVS